MTVRPEIFFLPGAGADPAFWRPVGDRLPADWGKTYFGWPGLGRQPPQAGIETLDDLAGLVEARLGPRPVDLVAQSMGGVIALRVAARHPGRIRRLVLAVTSGGLPTADLGAQDWRADYLAAFPNAAGFVLEAAADMTGTLAAVSHPALLLWGTNDPISPPLVGARLAARLARARLVVLEGGDHDLARDRAHEVGDLVKAHLEGPEVEV